MSNPVIFDIETIEKGSDMNQQAAQEQLDRGSELPIPAETISEQEEVSSSLCDRFGIHMFTESFIETEENVTQAEGIERQETLDNVMTNTKGYTLLDSLQTVMDAETEAIIKKEYENKQDTESGAVLALYGILGAILAGFVLYYIEKIRKGRKKIENNRDVSELPDGPGL